MLVDQAKLAEHTGDSSILDGCKKSTGSMQSKKKKNKKKKAKQARKKQQVTLVWTRHEWRLVISDVSTPVSQLRAVV